MKRVLITGAAGFIGERCLPFLVARGYEVHAVSRSARPQNTDRLTSQNTDAVTSQNTDRVTWHKADLLDTTATAELLNHVRPTHLMHLAWYTEHGKFWSAVENLQWVGASIALFENFAAAGGKRTIATGTCVEYAPPGDAPCAEASTPLVPTTLYGACKHAVQVVFDAFARQAELSAAWGRIFFPYGPGEPPERLIPSVARALLAGEPARCTHGRQVRDFIYVDDVAGALVSLLDSSVEGAVNIASGEPVTLRQVIGKVAEHTGGAELVELGAKPAPEGEPPSLFADARRLRDEVGWSPRYGLDEGIGATVAWWRQQVKP